MMKWPHALIAGSALILLTNAVALLGAWYNRNGDPESQLQLTQRELRYSTWHEHKDNSGITLTLDWRIEQTGKNDSDYSSYGDRWGMPIWLDKAKMAELGFDVDKLGSSAGPGRRQKGLQPKEALLVLEINGQAYQHQLQRANEYVEQLRKSLAENPSSEAFKSRTKSAEENLQREQQKSSRLFVINAGLDLQKLRAAYSDRVRYAIVQGLIRPTAVIEKNETRIGGVVSALLAERIYVPFAYRQLFGATASYEATVAFGKRMEPWIVVVSRIEAPK